MKTKTSILTTLMFAFLLIYPTRINAQTVTSKLDQVKLMQQWLGTWQGIVGKDSIEVWGNQQYGKAFIGNVNYNIKGKISPYYISNFCFDSKEGNFKGFLLSAEEDYSTWIGFWATEKKFTIDVVQNFNPKVVNYKVEFVYVNPKEFTATSFNTNGTKTWEAKYNKVK